MIILKWFTLSKQVETSIVWPIGPTYVSRAVACPPCLPKTHETQYQPGFSFLKHNYQYLPNTFMTTQCNIVTATKCTNCLQFHQVCSEAGIPTIPELHDATAWWRFMPACMTCLCLLQLGKPYLQRKAPLPWWKLGGNWYIAERGLWDMGKSHISAPAICECILSYAHRCFFSWKDFASFFPHPNLLIFRW